MIAVLAIWVTIILTLKALEVTLTVKTLTEQITMKDMVGLGTKISTNITMQNSNTKKYNDCVREGLLL